MRNPAFPPDGDTIAAVSTPFGVGGIGIVRMSGGDSEQVVRRLFVPNRPTTCLQSHRLYYGTIRNPLDATLVDEALVTVMRAPRTYTREDMAELHCHGGPVPVRRVLELVLAEGVRLAGPGEFTRRAFLNGRIDLAQAEAVQDIVAAKSEAALRLAQRQLAGGTSAAIAAIREGVRDLLVEVEAWLDFPEEDLPEPEWSRWREVVARQAEAARALLETYRDGHWLRDGVTVVIGGLPNAGKSTLLNVLLGRERAIVAATPGTTRDFLEEDLFVGGIPVRLVDTAGIRESLEEAEAQGVARAREQVLAADLVLWVLDVSRDAEEGPAMARAPAPGERTILVLNKTDLVTDPELERLAAGLPDLPQVRVSARYGRGIEELRRLILSRLTDGRLDLDSRVVITNLRHRQALDRCLGALLRARGQVAVPEPPGDLLAQDLRQALRALGEVLGETAPAEILERIFESFCVGK